MLYIEHHDCENKYIAAQIAYGKILYEKERLFEITQPGAIAYDKTLVSGGGENNAFDTYLALKEKSRIDERLNEAKAILDDRSNLLTLKEAELKASPNYFDRVYYLRYIENLPVKQIAAKIPYCKTQIYEMLNMIKMNICKSERADKNGK